MMNKDREFMIASAVRDAVRKSAYVGSDADGNMEVCFDVIDLNAIIAAIQNKPVTALHLYNVSALDRAMLAAALQYDRRQNRRPALLAYSTPGSEWRIPSEPEKLSNPVRVGGVNFHKGVSIDRVIRHAERQYEWWKEERDTNKVAVPVPNGYVRYCRECGRIGDVPDGYRDCCPDGNHAVYVHPGIAEQAQCGFRTMLDGALQTAVELPELPKPEGMRRKMRTDGGYDMIPCFTADQMRGYASAALAKAKGGA